MVQAVPASGTGSRSMIMYSVVNCGLGYVARFLPINFFSCHFLPGTHFVMTSLVIGNIQIKFNCFVYSLQSLKTCFPY